MRYQGYFYAVEHDLYFAAILIARQGVIKWLAKSQFQQISDFLQVRDAC